MWRCLTLAPLVGCAPTPAGTCDSLIQYRSFFATAVDELGDTALGLSLVYERDGAPPVEVLCGWQLATGDCLEWISDTGVVGHFGVTASGEGYADAVLEAEVGLNAEGDTVPEELDFEMVSL